MHHSLHSSTLVSIKKVFRLLFPTTMSDNGEGLVKGIDLGTTYSCVVVWQHDHIVIIVNYQGMRTTPSYVAFTHMEHLVGDAVKNQVARNPTNSVFGNLHSFFFFFFVCVILKHIVLYFPLIIISLFVKITLITYIVSSSHGNNNSTHNYKKFHI